LTLNIESCGWP